MKLRELVEVCEGNTIDYEDRGQGCGGDGWLPWLPETDERYGDLEMEYDNLTRKYISDWIKQDPDDNSLSPYQYRIVF